MIDGSQGRRTVRGSAGIALLLILAAGGCAHLPVPRPNTTPIHIPPPRPAGLSPEEPPAQGADPSKTIEPLPPLPPLEETSPPPPSEPQTALLDEGIRLARLPVLSEEGPPPLEPEKEAAGPSSAAGSAPAATPGPSSAPNADAAGLPPTVAPEPERAKPQPVTKAETLAALAPRPINPEKPVVRPSPRELWREGLDRLRELAGEQSRIEDRDAGLWTLRFRLLKEVDALDHESAGTGQALWRVLLPAVTASRTSGGTDEHRRAAEIRAAVSALEEEQPLEITALQLCRRVNGFGSFEPIDPAACKPGQAVIVYCEMSGLRYSAAGGVFHSRLASRVELTPTAGGKVVWSDDLGVAEDLCRRRRRDYYVNYRLVLPDRLPPGTYQLNLLQSDELAGRTTAGSLVVTIEP
jgi:hypothetical protein